jgi:vacuolar-type H+-ATPase subunit E/Vma4
VESAKERLDRIRGDREELALAKDVEELVPAASVQDRLVQVVLAIRTEMLNGGSKLKTELDALYEIDCDIEVINEHNRSILRHLASLGRQSDVGDSGSIGEIRASTEDAVG